MGQAIRAHREIGRAYFTPVPVLASTVVAILTPPWFEGPAILRGGLIAGSYAGAIMAEEKPRDIRGPWDACIVVACVVVGFLGLVASTLLKAIPIAQFVASALTGVWATWIGPRALWGLMSRFHPRGKWVKETA